MLDKLMVLYQMSMTYDVRSPMPHLVGPAGCGKSTYVEQLAELLGVELHVLNVSRLSPLEAEGVQMPHGTGEDMALKMLPSTVWANLKEGDILLLDEFLRGFPETYNALLDVFTSRRVGAFRLPKIFIIGASNSVTTYDQALEDRLLHLPVPDPRKRKTEKAKIANLIVDVLGLMPEMADSAAMHDMLDKEVLPTYDVLDSFKSKGVKVGSGKPGSSVRNLLGQAQLRVVTSTYLKDLIEDNNQRALRYGKAQYMLLLYGTKAPHGAHEALNRLASNPRLTGLQRTNVEMNLQLIEMKAAATTTSEEDEHD